MEYCGDGESRIFPTLKARAHADPARMGSETGGTLPAAAGNEEVMRDMEEILITADVGIQATQKLLDAMRQQVLQGWENNPEEFSSRLQNEIVRILMEHPLHREHRTDSASLRK